jgi:predicted RNA binding protein YcfA (HicA-like mRNA interferase family)
MKAADIIKKLKKQGWEQARQKGSHVQMKKDGVTCPVPVHGSKDVRIGTLKSIERITGVKLT